MATTVRLPDQLQVEATSYAQTLGLSLNSIIAVSLREYLDRRKGTPLVPVEGPPEAVSAAVPKVSSFRREKPIEPTIQAPANRRAPCPCGSGKRYSQCHGLKEAVHEL